MVDGIRKHPILIAICLAVVMALFVIIFDFMGKSSSYSNGDNKDNLSSAGQNSKSQAQGGNDLQDTKIGLAELYGVNSSGMPYVIKSDAVNQNENGDHELQYVHGKYNLDKEGNKYLSVHSKDGVLYVAQNYLELLNDVDVEFSEGYRLVTEKLQVDFSKMTISTNDAVEINSVKGKLFSEGGMIQELDKKVVYFNGPIKTILNH